VFLDACDDVVVELVPPWSPSALLIIAGIYTIKLKKRKEKISPLPATLKNIFDLPFFHLTNGKSYNGTCDPSHSSRIIFAARLSIDSFCKALYPPRLNISSRAALVVKRSSAA